MRVELLRCVEVGPGEGARGAVLWLHGLGASGHDFEEIVPMLKAPDVRFVFPHAPRRAVTINMGLVMPAWYDIKSLEDRRDEDEGGIRASQAAIEALIARELERGVPSERLVLAGFSQGGALALFAAMRHARKLAGIMVLSGYELLPKARAKETSAANLETPLIVCHGSHDPVVPRAAGRGVFEAYAHDRRPSEWHEYPMAHAICLEEIDAIRTWLQALLQAPLVSSATE